MEKIKNVPTQVRTQPAKSFWTIVILVQIAWAVAMLAGLTPMNPDLMFVGITVTSVGMVLTASFGGNLR